MREPNTKEVEEEVINDLGASAAKKMAGANDRDDVLGIQAREGAEADEINKANAAREDRAGKVVVHQLLGSGRIYCAERYTDQTVFTIDGDVTCGACAAAIRDVIIKGLRERLAPKPNLNNLPRKADSGKGYIVVTAETVEIALAAQDAEKGWHTGMRAALESAIRVKCPLSIQCVSPFLSGIPHFCSGENGGG
jgi:hypothetical protein